MNKLSQNYFQRLPVGLAVSYKLCEKAEGVIKVGLRFNEKVLRAVLLVVPIQRKTKAHASTFHTIVGQSDLIDR